MMFRYKKGTQANPDDENRHLIKENNENNGRVRKKPGWRIAACVAAFVAAAGIAGALYVSSKLDKISYEPKTEKAPAETVQEAGQESAQPVQERTLEGDSDIEIIESTERPEGGVFEDKDVVNILLIGSDRRVDNMHDLGRADCTMLCSLNKKTGDVKLISFERGIYVKFDVWPYEDILTHTFAFGGPSLTADVIREYFLLDIEGYVCVEFEAFEKGIDALGGVDIELTEKEADALNNKLWKKVECHAVMEPGMNHMDGHDALNYCRLRFIDSNWHRIERQRNTIQAALNALRGSSLGDLNGLADEVLPLISTDLTKGELASLILNAPKFIGARAGQMTVPKHEEGEQNNICNFENESQRLKEFIYG